MPPHRGAGQAPQVRHDGFGIFYEIIKFVFEKENQYLYYEFRFECINSILQENM
jgi:hypothetical protein